LTRIRRWRRSRVQPLSVFDLPLEDGLFWERVGAERLEALRRAGRSDRGIGEEFAAQTAAALRRLREPVGFDAAWISGGLTLLPGFREILQESPGLPVTIDGNGVFAGEAGGFRLLQDTQFRGAVIDVGQTSIKASCLGQRLVRQRDQAALPLEWIDPGGALPSRSAMRLENAARFIGDAIADALGAANASEASLVLALPCALDEACVPGPCTYGFQGEAVLVPRSLEHAQSRLAGVRIHEVIVLNDAELAAESALATGGATAARTLVLTLGFGPGGALIG
jgi:hypothetical protein